MRTVTLSGTSNSGTILSVGTPDSSTGRRSKSTTSTWNSRSQRELTVNQLSGKLRADHRPDQPPPADPGMIPLTIPEIKRLLAALTTRPLPPPHVIHWDKWTRRHQARSRWYHQRARLAREPRSPWSASEMRLPYLGDPMFALLYVIARLRCPVAE